MHGLTQVGACSIFVAIATAWTAVPARAVSATWTLSDVNLGDGGIAEGYFITDDSEFGVQTLTDVDIVTVTDITLSVYDGADVCSYRFINPSYLSCYDGFDDAYFTFNFSSDLLAPSNGEMLDIIDGIVVYLPGDGIDLEYETRVVSGSIIASVIAPVPLPAGGALLLGGIGAFATLRRRGGRRAA